MVALFLFAQGTAGICRAQPTKGAVNIGVIVGVSGGQPTKGAVNIGDQVWRAAH